MSEHTKGRLVVKDFGCRAFLLTEADDDIAFDILKPNARRLAACWNALEKIDQKTLDMGWTGIGCMEAAHKHEERAAALAKELAAARALLREVLKANNFNSRLKLYAKVESYLDACDTLEGKL